MASHQGQQILIVSNDVTLFEISGREVVEFFRPQACTIPVELFIIGQLRR